jgi:uncharacterized heparinase superfamily protein
VYGLVQVATDGRRAEPQLRAELGGGAVAVDGRQVTKGITRQPF